LEATPGDLSFKIAALKCGSDFQKGLL